MTIEKVQENGKQEKSTVQQCAEEVDQILQKHKCQLVCERQIVYGQQIWVPTITPLPDKK